MGGPTLARGKPEHHLTLGSWQKARLAMKVPTPCGVWAALMRGADPSATWRLGLGKRLDCL